MTEHKCKNDVLHFLLFKWQLKFESFNGTQDFLVIWTRMAIFLLFGFSVCQNRLLEHDILVQISMSIYYILHVIVTLKVKIWSNIINWGKNLFFQSQNFPSNHNAVCGFWTNTVLSLTVIKVIFQNNVQVMFFLKNTKVAFRNFCLIHNHLPIKILYKILKETLLSHTASYNIISWRYFQVPRISPEKTVDNMGNHYNTSIMNKYAITITSKWNKVFLALVLENIYKSSFYKRLLFQGNCNKNISSKIVSSQHETHVFRRTFFISRPMELETIYVWLFFTTILHTSYYYKVCDYENSWWGKD
jgi:hypothetical protein